MAIATPTRGIRGAAGAAGTGFNRAALTTLTTTDATVTNIASVAAPQNAMTNYELFVTAYNPSTGVGASFVRWLGVQRQTGNATLTTGGVSGGFQSKDAAISSATIGITTSGSNLVVQVAGVAAITLDWECQLFIRSEAQ